MHVPNCKKQGEQSHPHSTCIAFEVAGGASTVTCIRHKVRLILNALELFAEDCYDIEVIVCELLTNAALHARATNYRVNIELLSSRAIITVADNGIGFSPQAIPEPGTPRPNRMMGEPRQRVGGYGLLLVQSLSEHVEITQEPKQGSIIRVVKKLNNV